VVRELWELIHL
jgi:hypothetical protein